MAGRAAARSTALRALRGAAVRPAGSGVLSPRQEPRHPQPLAPGSRRRGGGGSPNGHTSSQRSGAGGAREEEEEQAEGQRRDRPLRAGPDVGAGRSAAFAKTNLSPEGAGPATFSRSACGPTAPLEDRSESVKRSPSKPPRLTPAPAPLTEVGAQHPARAPAGEPLPLRRLVAAACTDPRIGVTAGAFRDRAPVRSSVCMCVRSPTRQRAPGVTRLYPSASPHAAVTPGETGVEAWAHLPAEGVHGPAVPRVGQLAPPRGDLTSMATTRWWRLSLSVTISRASPPLLRVAVNAERKKLKL